MTNDDTDAGARARRGAPAGGRLRRQAWIDAGIAFLCESNVEALRVDVLAERLGVTKGSFYHHFESRDALLDAIVETWRSRTTNEIEGFILGAVGSAHGRLKRLVRIGMGVRPDVPGGPLEMSLRDWARRDPRIAGIMCEVDDRRLAFLQGLYEERGLAAKAARHYALLHLSYVIGGRQLVTGRPLEMWQEAWDVGERELLPPRPSDPGDAS